MSEIKRFVNAMGEITTINQVDDEKNPHYGEYLLVVWDDRADRLGRVAKAPTLLDAGFAQELVDAIKEIGLAK